VNPPGGSQFAHIVRDWSLTTLNFFTKRANADEKNLSRRKEKIARAGVWQKIGFHRLVRYRGERIGGIGVKMRESADDTISKCPRSPGNGTSVLHHLSKCSTLISEKEDIEAKNQKSFSTNRRNGIFSLVLSCGSNISVYPRRPSMKARSFHGKCAQYDNDPVFE
jgi:hypothetical protein